MPRLWGRLIANCSADCMAWTARVADDAASGHRNAGAMLTLKRSTLLALCTPFFGLAPSVAF